MYIVDGIAYAGHPQEALKIVHIRILDDLYMMVTFASGEKRLFDVSPLLSYPVYAPYRSSHIPYRSGSARYDCLV